MFKVMKLFKSTTSYSTGNSETLKSAKTAEVREMTPEEEKAFDEAFDEIDAAVNSVFKSMDDAFATMANALTSVHSSISTMHKAFDAASSKTQDKGKQ